MGGNTEAVKIYVVSMVWRGGGCLEECEKVGWTRTKLFFSKAPKATIWQKAKKLHRLLKLHVKTPAWPWLHPTPPPPTTRWVPFPTIHPPLCPPPTPPNELLMNTIFASTSSATAATAFSYPAWIVGRKLVQPKTQQQNPPDPIVTDPNHLFFLL